MSSRFAFFVSALLFVQQPALASNLPDMLCQAREVLALNPKTFKTTQYESHEIYRFAKDKLFIQSPDREEYLYGKLTEIEPMRFIVGHKTIIFTSSEFTTATVIHSNDTEVRVVRLSRVKT